MDRTIRPRCSLDITWTSPASRDASQCTQRNRHSSTPACVTPALAGGCHTRDLRLFRASPRHRHTLLSWNLVQAIRSLLIQRLVVQRTLAFRCSRASASCLHLASARLPLCSAWVPVYPLWPTQEELGKMRAGTLLGQARGVGRRGARSSPYAKPGTPGRRENKVDGRHGKYENEVRHRPPRRFGHAPLGIGMASECAASSRKPVVTSEAKLSGRLRWTRQRPSRLRDAASPIGRATRALKGRLTPGFAGGGGDASPMTRFLVMERA
jgi:hypothetical protein